MTDTSVLKPKWQLILGLLPSLNTSLIAIVTAAVSVVGTLATQRLAAPPALKPVAAQPAPVQHELTLILGNTQTLIDDVRALRKDFKAPPPAPTAAPARPVAKALAK